MPGTKMSTIVSATNKLKFRVFNNFNKTNCYFQRQYKTLGIDFDTL